MKSSIEHWSQLPKLAIGKEVVVFLFGDPTKELRSAVRKLAKYDQVQLDRHDAESVARSLNRKSVVPSIGIVEYGMLSIISDDPKLLSEYADRVLENVRNIESELKRKKGTEAP
jgi:hypothetical protein